MKPTRIWLGLVLLALGVFGVLDVIGTLAWDDTVGPWAMPTRRRMLSEYPRTCGRRRRQC